MIRKTTITTDKHAEYAYKIRQAEQLLREVERDMMTYRPRTESTTRTTQALTMLHVLKTELDNTMFREHDGAQPLTADPYFGDHA